MSGEEKRQDQDLEEILATSKRKWRELIEIISSNFYAEMGISPVNEGQSFFPMSKDLENYLAWIKSEPKPISQGQ